MNTPPIDDQARERFDAIIDQVLAALPEQVLALLDEVPLIVLDEPPPEILDALGIPPEERDHEAATLCGLHSGYSMLEQSVEVSGELPTQMHLFRRGTLHAAGGWDDQAEVAEQIRITILHEIGHHFGLEEDDLDRLGYA